MNYSALIRTFNSERTLPATLESLNRQTIRPQEIIFVDSGSTDKTLSLFPPGALVHRYVGVEFNYSEALNQGLRLVSNDHVLIISSHTTLEHEKSLEYALGVLDRETRIGAAYFCHQREGPLRYEWIDKHNFDGHNGLWNTCSLIRMALLRERGFQPEIFASEDQEWASWLYRCKGGATAQICGAGMEHENPRQNSLRRGLNEAISIAYFANRKLLGWRNLARVAYHVVKPSFEGTLRDRIFSTALFFQLLGCRFVKPKRRSRYF